MGEDQTEKDSNPSLYFIYQIKASDFPLVVKKELWPKAVLAAF